MEIIGRKSEQDQLLRCAKSKMPEFMVIYGRRRVGKTFLIREVFKNDFTFYTSGVKQGTRKDKVALFHKDIVAYGGKAEKKPESWFDAFDELKDLLKGDCHRNAVTGKKIVFLDEVPWMDGKKSDFRPALDRFWNMFGSAMPDLMLIVCGSATSWIIDNILKNTGGFYNRVTESLHLLPFHLGDCERLCRFCGYHFEKSEILEYYMAFGGVPFYWRNLNASLSVSQNIQSLCFEESGKFRYEYRELFRSLFSPRGRHREVVEFICKKNKGVPRDEISKSFKMSGKQLTKTLEELEECGFLREYVEPGHIKRGKTYQVIDPFVRFSIAFLQGARKSSWTAYRGTPAYYAWAGNAFELACLNHVTEIKNALGIAGVETSEYAWRSKESNPGAQIDLLIDRADGVINLLEMKYTQSPIVIDKDYRMNLLTKEDDFRRESKTRKAIRITLVASSGLSKNGYSDVIDSLVTGKDLFQ